MSGAVISCGHPVTAEAAAAVLADGGNAFDAALAAMVTVPMSEPVLGSLGGGGFMLAQPSGGAPVIYDFFCDTPLKTRPRDELEFVAVQADFGADQQTFHTGFGAVATPGMVAGLFAVHADLGHMPISEILTPAIAAAKSGVKVNDLQAFIMHAVTPILHFSPSVREVFQDQENNLQCLQPGELFQLPGYDGVLDALAHEGPRLFYEGEIGAIIEENAISRGGSIRRADLAQFEVIRRRPLLHKFAGAEIFLNPAPSSGGPLISFSLELAAEILSDAPELPNGERLAYLVEIMAATNAARAEAQGRHDNISDRLAALKSDDFIAKHRRDSHRRAQKIGGTTHISIIDKDGNVAAISQSNGEGCGHILPGTGIQLNNMLGEEDLNRDGFFNFSPASRISSMMCPTLINQANGPQIVLGSGGSNRIRTAILQVVLNCLAIDMSLEEAIAAPRVHREDSVTHIEGALPPEVRDFLQDQFDETKIWPDDNFFFGGVHAARRSLDGKVLEGMGDPRRGGCHLLV